MLRIKRARSIAAVALAAALSLSACGPGRSDGTAADEAPGQMSPTSGGAVEDGAPVDTTSAPVQGTTTP
jgi:hypothetical protein